MTAPPAAARPGDGPPYLLALLAAAAVLAGYVVTLAPTVTFWDAGEFIASAHILGIPHPPGTPLYVLLAHSWDVLIPGLPTAVKLNLLSAICSAGCSGFFFLFAHEALRRGAAAMDDAGARLFRVGGAFAATLCSGYAFTVWQISNDAGKVYTIAMLLIGLSAWLAWLWRRDRGGPRGAHLLLLIMYILGLALANHLIGLLAGPALFAFVFHVLRTEPAKAPAERRVQWAQFLVMVALWAALVGLSQGRAGTALLVLGLALYVAAAVWAFRVGTGMFGVAALVVAALGISTYAFLFIRAGLYPYVNEADASTLRNLWAVIGREQYPPRSPLDNPMFYSGPWPAQYPGGPFNPGRFFVVPTPQDPSYRVFTLKIVGLQILNWLQYFDWQWSGFQRHITLLAPARLPWTLLFVALGIHGMREHRKWDRASWWFLLALFATTSIGLVVYLNFKPGFSLGLQSFPDREMHEVRERDYFYTISFLCWGLWAGLGVAAAFRAVRERLGSARAAAPVFLLAALPLALNFHAASRRHGPEATLARDFAYDMLQSVEPYGLLFTNGDNDTFPLWYLQEVEGVRQDVVNVNLSLVNTDWYIRQLRDNPARPYRPDSAALALYGPGPAAIPSCTPAQLDTLQDWARRSHRRPLPLDRGTPACLHMLPDDVIAGLQPQLLPRDVVLSMGGISHTYRAGTPLYVKDILTLRLIQENLGKRPIYFALTAGGGARMGLERYMTQQGLAFKLWPDSVPSTAGIVSGLWGTALDVDRTRRLVWNVYRYARLLEADSLHLDPTNENIAANISFGFLSLGEAYRQLGQVDSMVLNYRRAAVLSPTPDLLAWLRQFDEARRTPDILGADSARADSARRDSARGGTAGRGGARR